VVAQERLWDAASRGDCRAAAGAVDAGASLDAGDAWADGQGSMHLAAARGDAEMLRWLLDRGARAGVACMRGRTPLHCAAASGAVPCVEVLLSAGADAGACDADGELPPPEYACCNAVHSVAWCAQAPNNHGLNAVAAPCEMLQAAHRRTWRGAAGTARRRFSSDGPTVERLSLVRRRRPSLCLARSGRRKTSGTLQQNQLAPKPPEIHNRCQNKHNENIPDTRARRRQRAPSSASNRRPLTPLKGEVCADGEVV